jgi:hypothetical protein
MVNIQPVLVWNNGQEIEATVLSAVIISDDLATNAQFYYQLLSAPIVDVDGLTVNNGQSLVGGNVSMGGEDYISWDDSNSAAYQFVADQLNLTII